MEKINETALDSFISLKGFLAQKVEEQYVQYGVVKTRLVVKSSLFGADVGILAEGEIPDPPRVEGPDVSSQSIAVLEPPRILEEGTKKWFEARDRY